MTPAELRQIARAVREEIRAAALLDVPPDFRGPPPYDLDAERAVIAGAYAEHRPSIVLVAGDFWVPLHGGVYETIVEALARGIRPRPALVAAGVGRLGIVGREVSEQVAELLDTSPIALPIDKYARRVLRLSRLRRMRLDLERIIATSASAETDVEDVALLLRAAADDLTAPPTRASSATEAA